MKTSRILIPDEDFDGTAIKTAFQRLGNITAEDTTIKDCILFVPAKANLQKTTLSAILGENSSNALSNGNSLKFGSFSLRAKTKRSFKNYCDGDAVLAVYADQKMMDSVDSNGNFKVIVCVPLKPDAVDQWVRTWNLETTGEQGTVKNLISNQVIEAALISIISRINLANRILNPRDAEAVKDAFRILRAHNQTEDPKNIRAWCIKHDCDSEVADEVMKYATKAFKLKLKPTKYGEHWVQNIYEEWVKKSNAR